ncbi:MULTISPECIES: LysR family transcriptional regulator [Vibrio]|jgi:DNA-binding transcriptional LysR family regulator|uniref:LysR family transcriptional regulator n=1 Tax=Vibrio jasicida TaxID=766224 RepID=A0AAU9QNA4_9VIBR|nr:MULTISPECIES: LysR family transcriptional regulator [Vibrio]KIP69415.1 LysR family transcriptional regulator [Vibrio harveyi]MCX2791856.1 LysR family transcriptional regulator [Vibrio sp. Sgm 5]NOJ18828.1 LysR family transcriptional regulator [Vibrio jasicida]PAW09439.1 LysR family transcriptional regulator [Vibrio sp. V1B]PMO36755.1 LysR family transcriptional regulator [Vibrio sp. 10N.222.52.B12]
MKLHFENIVSFVAVVEEGSFSSAARKLGKSQSTVSTAVQNLESDLGFNLFNRQYSKVWLNEKGKRLFHLSAPVVSKYRELMTTAQQMNISEQIVYRVGIDPLVFNQEVKKTLLDFSEAFPNVDLLVVTKPSFVLGNYINEGKIDLALGNPYHKTGNDFNIDELFHVNCWWVAHEDLTHIGGSPSQRVLLMDGCEELLNLSNIAAYNLWRLDDLGTILDLCKAQKGIAFLPEFLIEGNIKENKLKLINDHPDFFGKRVIASLFWPLHSDFSLFNQWIKGELQSSLRNQQTFVADLAQ